MASACQGITVAQESGEISNLDDTDLLARRAKIRELLEITPDESAEATALISEYADLTAEFDRRAHAKWNRPRDGQAPGGEAADENSRNN
jgi:hypothetical protein